MSHSGNFGFLAGHSPLLAQLGTAAENVFAADPNTTLIKLRQFGEAMAQDLAARLGVEFEGQADLLYRLEREARLDRTIRGLFHTLRVEVNKATHEFTTKHKEAMDGLKVARSTYRGNVPAQQFQARDTRSSRTNSNTTAGLTPERHILRSSGPRERCP